MTGINIKMVVVALVMFWSIVVLQQSNSIVAVVNYVVKEQKTPNRNYTHPSVPTTATTTTPSSSSSSSSSTSTTRSATPSSSSSEANSETNSDGSSSSSSVASLTDGVDIVHLYNPFASGDCENDSLMQQDPILKSFCPYDQAQSMAIASMRRAQQFAFQNNISVVLTAVTFDDQRNLVPDGFWALPPLNRSTATEYPHLSIDGEARRLPFLQDIFDSFLSSSSVIQNVRYIVYTNSDIILHEGFYKTVLNILQGGNYAFTINRHTVPNKTKPNGQLYTPDDLDWLYHNASTKRHPGYDCFVFSHDLLPQLKLGNVFVGYPPLGVALLAQLAHHATKFRRFRTYELRGTFHLGNDDTWRINTTGIFPITTMKESDNNNDSSSTGVGSSKNHQAYRDQNTHNADLLPISWRSMLGRHRPNSLPKA